MIIISAEHIRAAAGEVRRAIEEMQGPMPPVFVVEFLLKEWRRYLALVHQESGEGSEAWGNAVAAMGRLLWSVTPKANATERASLSEGLAELVATLKTGMKEVNTQQDVRDAFLASLSEAHLAILHTAEVPARPQSEIASAAERPDGAVHGDDTITMDVRDPRYRELLDLLSTDNVEQIDIK